MPSRFNPISSPPFQSSTPTFRGGSGFGTGSSSGLGTQQSVGVTSPFMSPPTRLATSSFLSPQQQQQQQQQQQPPQSTTKGSSSSTPSQSKFKSKSLALSCQSPDALAIHTLINNSNSNSTSIQIQTQTLPLHQKSSKTIQTNLPSWLCSSFQVDPPCEILCIDNDTNSSSSLKALSKDGIVELSKRKKILLPLLCIYTIKSIYVIEISVLPDDANADMSTSTSTSTNADSFIYQGKIESIHEPIERYLNAQNEENDFTLTIQRVRSAPYTHLFGGTMYNLSPFIPRGCMAILLTSSKDNGFGLSGGSSTRYGFVDDEIDEDESCYSQLVLYHGIDYENKNDISTGSGSGSGTSSITVSHLNTSFEPIVDFTFLPSFNTTTSASTSTSSNSSSLWNGMSIALSTKIGEIYTMAPIVFHGMTVPKHLLLDAIQNLKSNITKISNNHEKENKQNDSNSNSNALSIQNENNNDDIDNALLYRRNMAALAYIKDVFGVVTNDNNNDDDRKNNSRQKKTGGPFVVTANILNHINMKRSAASWPMAIQGPVYTPEESCRHEVSCMESLPPPLSLSTSSSSLHDDISCTIGYTSSVILARGEDGQCVQYVMIPSGVNCIPRFEFESSDDCNTLDGMVENTGTLIEEIWLENDDDDDDDTRDENELALLENRGSQRGSRGKQGQRSVVIIIDPIDSSMVHHLSKFGVVTMTTNAMKVMNHRLRRLVSKAGGNEDEEIKTKAWSSIDILEKDVSPSGNYSHVSGVNVSGDAKIGHILVAVLCDGKTEAINLTASQYLNEANNSKNETNQSMIVKSDEEKEADEALMAMEKVPILQEEIQPLLGQISSGLSGMSKIVGGSTEPRNATAGTLATFMSTTQSNEQDIILPLRELHALVSSRLPYLRSMRENQTQQLDRLNKMIKTLEARIKLTNEKRVTIENNSKLLSQKSADVLETARELTPTITEAEREYFKDIQRFGVNCGKFEETFSELRDTCKALCQGVESAQAEIKIKTQMTEDQKETCKALLEGQKSKLTESEKAIKRVETQMKKFVAEKGMK